ncbi:MAG: HAD-IIA family hydrolase [Acutalibacteraceae bacterium]|jgi:HAD superfamily hydrolase (TIGR01457 family)
MHPICSKKLFLLDMDGTLYLGNHLFPQTLPFLSAVRSHGGRCIYVTNNSSKSVDAYVQKLAQLGIAAKEDDFLTSSQATARYLRKMHPETLFYVLGTHSLKQELAQSGVAVTDQLSDSVGGLVMGYDTELTFQKLEDACRLLLRDIPYIATNPDWVCPTEFGYVPDCGSVSTMLKNATGKWPKFIGKPEPEMIRLAMEKTGFAPEETIVIGDRIYTDIASGLNAGVSTALVLSGETTREVLEASERKPEFVFDSVGNITALLQ